MSQFEVEFARNILISLNINMIECFYQFNLTTFFINYNKIIILFINYYSYYYLFCSLPHFDI